MRNAQHQTISMPEHFICPGCEQPLVKGGTSHGVFWSCAACGGKALGVELLRRTFAAESINAFWWRAVANQGSGGRPCPCCRNAMIKVKAGEAAAAPDLDVCKLCHFVWFDSSELESMKPRPADQSPEARPSAPRSPSMKQIEESGLDADQRDGRHSAQPEWWELLANLLDLAVHLDARRL